MVVHKPARAPRTLPAHRTTPAHSAARVAHHQRLMPYLVLQNEWPFSIQNHHFSGAIPLFSAFSIEISERCWLYVAIRLTLRAWWLGSPYGSTHQASTSAPGRARFQQKISPTELQRGKTANWCRGNVKNSRNRTQPRTRLALP